MTRSADKANFYLDHPILTKDLFFNYASIVFLLNKTVIIGVLTIHS